MHKTRYSQGDCIRGFYVKMVFRDGYDGWLVLVFNRLERERERENQTTQGRSQYVCCFFLSFHIKFSLNDSNHNRLGCLKAYSPVYPRHTLLSTREREKERYENIRYKIAHSYKLLNGLSSEKKTSIKFKAVIASMATTYITIIRLVQLMQRT